MDWSRQQVLDAAWDASSWQFPDGFTLSDFKLSVADWDLWPVEVGHELAGAIMVKGAEMHCCIKPEFFRRWATKALWRKVMRHKIRHGMLTTSVHVDHDAGRDFVERFGFRCIGNQNHILMYELR